MRARILALLLLSVMPVALHRAGAAATAPLDNRRSPQGLFMAAMSNPGLPRSPDDDPPSLRTYVLYDYLRAARLRYALHSAPGKEWDDAIDSFLTALGTQPVTRALRHDWLIDLARRRQWDRFLARAEASNDPVLECDRLEGRLETGQIAALGADALRRWILPQRQPSECDRVFEWLHQQGLISLPLIEVRTRAALARGNARLGRSFAQELPPAEAAPLLQWAGLLESPAAELAALAADPARTVDPAALAAGFHRLARSNPARALEVLPGLLARIDITAEQRAILQRDAALGAAYDRLPGALSALAAVPTSALSDEVWQWRIRSALWNGRFDQARVWLEQMPSALASQPRWRYWHARTLAATRGAAAAQATYAELASLRDYYGYLAADRLHRDYSLDAQSAPDDPDRQAALAAQPGLMRAHALFECSLWDDAGAEWGEALAGADNATRVQAARLAEQWGWYAQAIATLAHAGEWNDIRLRYPRPFADQVLQASERTRVPSDWIMAVMRQESLFRQDAVSRAGARGLMQLLPGTAAGVAHRWALPFPGAQALFEPAESLTLGAAYLRELLDRYDGQLAPALAAYNAGTSSVARWMPGAPLEADIWVESITYGETREYVQRIIEHIVAFSWVRDARPPRLATLLGPVSPPESNARGWWRQTPRTALRSR